MIDADGWCDWAERLPCPWSKTNAGINGVKGVFMHSAEGYADNLLNLALNGPLSWHASNLMDGRFIQHYPFTARCWHATKANTSYVGIENEGVYTVETSLNEAQIGNAVRVIRDLSDWKGWKPSRPVASNDTTYTLWEHREVPRIGGSATACPSGRIPWERIMAELNAVPPVPRVWLYGDEQAGEEVVGKQVFVWHLGVVINKIGDETGEFPGKRLHNEGGVFVEKEP